VEALLLIEGLRFSAVLGVRERERTCEQLVEIDLELTVNIARAVEDDRVENVVNYSAVVRLVRDRVRCGQYGLVERCAGQVALAILEEFETVSSVRVRVYKPEAVRGVDRVGVECLQVRA